MLRVDSKILPKVTARCRRVDPDAYLGEALGADNDLNVIFGAEMLPVICRVALGLATRGLAGKSVYCVLATVLAIA